jgi:HD-GYP domain-containing protein (c-di-GMP phosphodiesterase class II)
MYLQATETSSVEDNAMRLCAVEELKPGMVMARAIYDDNYRLLVSVGVVLDHRIIERLKKQGFYQVFIEEPGTEDVRPPEMISDKVRHQANRVLHRSFTNITNAAEIREATVEDVNKLLDKGTQYQHLVDIPDVRSIVKNIIEDLMSNNITLFEAPLFRGYLGRHYEHALNTAILAVLIGQRYRYDRQELIMLGMGGLLHDIGKMMLPKLLDKIPEAYDEEEAEMMEQHPLLGGRLLGTIPQASYKEIACVEQHHEQQDGKGYPRGFRGTNSEPMRHRHQERGYIFRGAEILAVANTYDNLLDPNFAAAPLTPIGAVERIIRLGGAVLNSTIVGAAVNTINVFPVGATVRITSHVSAELEGAEGVVFKSNEEDPSRPWVILLYDARGRRFSEKVTINLLEKKATRIALE